MKRFYIVQFCFLYATLLFGQSKVAPPPTKISLPSDTSKVVREKDQVETDDSELELPDVLILGKDRILKDVGGKGDFAPDSPKLVRPGDVYQPVSIWFKGEEEKPEYDKATSSIDKITWGGLQAGAYTTTVLEAGHWRKIPQGDFRVHGWMDRSNGQYNNSQYNQGGLAGKFGYQLSPKARGSVKGQYEYFRRGLHGAKLDEFTRRAGSGLFGADLEYDITTLSDGKLGFEIGGTSVTSDTSKKRFNYSSDGWYKLYYGYTTQLWKLQLSTNGQYTRETLEYTADSLINKSSFGDVGAEVLAPLSKIFTVTAGVNYQTNSSDSADTISKVAPFARLNFMPSNKAGVTALFYNGLEFRTFSDWWKQNPYINHYYNQIAEEVQFGLKLDVDVQILPAVNINAGFSRRWMDRLYYWERESVSQLISLNQMTDVRLTEFQVGASAQLTEKTRFQVDFINYSDQLDSTDAVTNVDRIPYRPNFRIPIRATVQLLSDMALSLEADIYGERRSQLNSTKRLPAFGLMNAQLTKDFREHFTAVVSVRNLLDSDFVVWENYPEMGVTVLGGIRARF